MTETRTCETAPGVVRPLWDEGWGTARAARRARRLGAYLTAAPLQLDGRGGAETRVEFAAAGGKGAARTDAAREFASAFGVEVRTLLRWHRTYAGEDRAVRQARVVTVHGPAEAVARFVAALPRVTDYAEQLATAAARTYGAWSRTVAAEEHMEWMDASDRRARAAAFRAAAFRVVVEVLAAESDTARTYPEARPELAPWDQVAAIAGGIAQYGWVQIGEAYDPAEAEQLMKSAHAADAAAAEEARELAAAQARRTARALAALGASDAEQLPLPFEAPAVEAEEEAELQPAAARVVVIPCSGAKLATAAEAGRIYTGSLHRLARRTADALTAAGGVVVVLSARHGFLRLDEVVQPYDHTWRDSGAVTVPELQRQAAELGLTGAAEVVLLTPGEYTKRAAQVWPNAATPLAHLGIGHQRGRLAALREDPAQYATAA
ncbi:DUF6884 domain-containing protein [Kitasatospora sp. NPDC001527]|uniref:DUF6884 domain-containing protein n=1 Tax=Kitasatospora sp. NPDC001527 TaxID=3154519 RepID=UPI003331F70A